MKPQTANKISPKPTSFEETIYPLKAPFVRNRLPNKVWLKALRSTRHFEEMERELMWGVEKEIEAKYREELIPIRIQMRHIEKRKKYQVSCANCGGMGCACPSPYELKEYRDLRKRMDAIYQKGI